MGNHYTPQKYLRGFCEPECDGMLCMYDKKLRCFKRASVKEVAQERGFYSDAVEVKLNEHIEKPANIVIDKVRQRFSLNVADRIALSMYIATMLVRVPRFRIRAAEWIPDALTDALNEIKDIIIRAASDGRIDRVTEARRLKEAEETGERFRKTTPDQVMDQIRTPWPRENFVALINAMAWRFFSTSGPSYFLTSDNPAFFFECDGLVNQKVELVFPISSELALHACWQDTWQDAVKPLSQRLVKEFNRRVASGATRFIFYREQAAWITAIANTPVDRLSRINW